MRSASARPARAGLSIQLPGEDGNLPPVPPANLSPLGHSGRRPFTPDLTGSETRRTRFRDLEPGTDGQRAKSASPKSHSATGRLGQRSPDKSTSPLSRRTNLRHSAFSAASQHDSPQDPSPRRGPPGSPSGRGPHPDSPYGRDCSPTEKRRQSCRPCFANSFLPVPDRPQRSSSAAASRLSPTRRRSTSTPNTGVGSPVSRAPSRNSTASDLGISMRRATSSRLGSRGLPHSDSGLMTPTTPSRGYADLRPKTVAVAVKNSDRAVTQPVLHANETLKRMSEKMIEKATQELTPAEKKKRALGRWKIAKAGALGEVRDATKTAKALVKWEVALSNAQSEIMKSKSGDYIRICRGIVHVKVALVKSLREEFDEMDTNGAGLVPYSKLLGRMDVGGGKGKLQVDVTSRLMSRRCMDTQIAKKKQGGGFEQRLAEQVFNFQDMLKMQFPQASPLDVDRMMKIAYPPSDRLGRLKMEKVERAVGLFHKADPEGTGMMSYQQLEELLINEYPKANVYKLIKTMRPDVSESLFSGGKIPMNEFINWHATLSNEVLFARQTAGTKKKFRPMDVFATYIEGHGDRAHFRRANMEATEKDAYAERRGLTVEQIEKYQ